MRSIKKKLLAAFAVAAALFGLVGVGAVEAGTYWTSSNCNHATAGNRICFDISSGAVTIYANNGAIQAGPLPAGWTGAVPSRGYIAYDFECNAGAGNETTFPTSGAYGFPTTVRFTDTWGPVPGLVLLGGADEATVAWYANSNQGYECIVVP